MGTGRSWGSLLILFTVMVLLTGCAATNSSYMEDSAAGTTDDTSELDQLLGQDDGQTGESGDTINEDDVLRLLGVSDEPAPETSLAAAEQSAGEVVPASDFSDAFSAEKTSPASAAPGASAANREDRAAPVFRADSYKDRYQEALQSYRARRYSDAVQKFEALLSTNAKHDLADNCQYWIGEAYYDQGSYAQAILAFEKVFTYPNSNKDDSAQLKLGLCYLKLNDKGKARDEFQELISKYPSSEYIGIARREMAQLGEPSPSP